MNHFSARARRAAFAALFFLLALPSLAQIKEVGDGHAGPFKADHLTVELVTLAPQIPAGGDLQIGLSFTIEEHWHVYWINAGDSGEPPAIKWTLSKGITAGPLQFPAPQRLPLGPLMDFGYQDQVTFPIKLSAAPKTRPGKVHLDARVNWLVCSSVCLPGKAHLGIDLNIVNGPTPEPPLVGALGASIKSLPQPPPATITASAVGDKNEILLTLHTGGREEDAEFYPFDQDIIDNAADQTVVPIADGLQIHLKRAPGSTKLPSDLHGLVKLSDTEVYDLHAAVAPGAIPASGAAKPAKDEQVSDVTFPKAIGLAFLGGIILNLMPCVFPVLFLKGLGLVNSSGEERRRQRTHGLVYTLGILVSFWAIVAILLILRAGGQQLGWGFQLQSPAFVAALASVTFFLALSLAGQFEIGLSLTSMGDELTRKQGFTGSFFTGVLATVVATPCVAPLMGAAVGFALAQSGMITFLVFTALALGLAFPYLVLTMQPGWAKILPRPGVWMEILKQLTAVPLFGTAIWLAWVFGNLYQPEGVDRVASLLVCFLILAIAGWALGRWPARWPATIAAVILICIALYVPLRKPAAETLSWQPYSDQALSDAQAAGHPVFIDFTAAWCLSCQVNERVVLHSKAIEKDFADGKYVLLKADWTKYDPAITKELASIGRSGVPAYVIYPAGKNVNPDVLPEVLTQSFLLKRLESDSKQPDKP